MKSCDIHGVRSSEQQVCKYVYSSFRWKRFETIGIEQSRCGAVRYGTLLYHVVRCGAESGWGSVYRSGRQKMSGRRWARRKEQFTRPVEDCVTLELEITVRGKEIQGGRFGRSVNASETGSHDVSLSRRGIRGAPSACINRIPSSYALRLHPFLSNDSVVPCDQREKQSDCQRCWYKSAKVSRCEMEKWNWLPRLYDSFVQTEWCSDLALIRLFWERALKGKRRRSLLARIRRTRSFGPVRNVQFAREQRRTFPSSSMIEYNEPLHRVTLHRAVSL